MEENNADDQDLRRAIAELKDMVHKVHRDIMRMLGVIHGKNPMHVMHGESTSSSRPEMAKEHQPSYGRDFIPLTATAEKRDCVFPTPPTVRLQPNTFLTKTSAGFQVENDPFMGTRPRRRNARLSTGFQHSPEQARLKYGKTDRRHFPAVSNFYPQAAANKIPGHDELCKFHHPPLRRQSWSRWRTKFKCESPEQQSYPSYQTAEFPDPEDSTKPHKIMRRDNAIWVECAPRTMHSPSYDP